MTTPTPRADEAIDLDRLDQLEKEATPAGEQSMLLDKWIEWRGTDGQKYSIAEFEREGDRDLYFAMRNALPVMARELRTARATLEKLAKTADGVPIVPGMKVFWQSANPDTIDGVKIETIGDDEAEFYNGHEVLAVPLEWSYSTQEAALAAEGTVKP